MAKPKAIQTLLLPERRRFQGQQTGFNFQSFSRKMSHINNLVVGESAQLKRHFQFIPNNWPIAALCRQAENVDAVTSMWLRADPIYLHAEMHGARVMAWDNLGLSVDEQSQILSALRPVFGDFGFELSASTHGYFYIRALTASPIPEFADAVDILGCDLSEYLPKDKKWLAMFNECQIILHNHPLNISRVNNQQTPINALWFWAAGQLPVAVQHAFSKIFTDDFTLSAFLSVPQNVIESKIDKHLIDVRKVRDWSHIESLFDASKEYLFDFADGNQWHWQPKMRWYFWRSDKKNFA
jgi:hypothetical protein